MSNRKKCSLQVLFLDADRNPIRNALYRIYVNGRAIGGSTGVDGLTKTITKIAPNDEVQIAIERLDKSIKTVARVIAESGVKIVALVSPKFKVAGPAMLHATPVSGQMPIGNDVTTPIYDPRRPKVPTKKKDLGPQVEQIKMNRATRSRKLKVIFQTSNS